MGLKWLNPWSSALAGLESSLWRRGIPVGSAGFFCWGGRRPALGPQTGPKRAADRPQKGRRPAPKGPQTGPLGAVDRPLKGRTSYPNIFFRWVRPFLRDLG